MRILVTGSSGCLARALLPALCADPAVTAVSGIDPKPPSFRHPRFAAITASISEAPARARLPGHDAVIHLAFVVLRGRMAEPDMRAINVDANAAFVAEAARAGVRRQVLLSSAALYGPGMGLTEASVPQPPLNFAYAQHKLALERAVQGAVPDCVRLRPHVILGPNAQPLLRWLLRQPFYPRLAPPEPPIQCVHEQDVVQAIRLALGTQCTGAFNLATPEQFSFGTAIRARHRHAAPLPLGVARYAIRCACQAWGFGGEPAWVDALARPLTIDCGRARNVLGWTPRFNARTALNEAAR